MKVYTIGFEISGGITVEAETVEEALQFFRSDKGQELVGLEIPYCDPYVTYIEEEDEF